MTLQSNTEKELEALQQKLNKQIYVFDTKNKPVKNIKLKFFSFCSDLFFNISGSVLIFFIIKNNFHFLREKKFFLALLLIFLVISSLYLTIKKYARVESNASIRN